MPLRERWLRWWHYRFWAWVGQLAPAGLIFECVLIAYNELYFSMVELKGPNGGRDMTGEHLLSYAGKLVEDAVKRPRRRKRRVRLWMISAPIGLVLGVVLGRLI